MADPIKYGWLPDKVYDPKLKREVYGWRSPEDFFIPNEIARNHFANLGGRKAPYKDYDEYWSSFGQKPQGANPLRIPFDDDTDGYAKRYRDIFKNQPARKRPAPMPPPGGQEDTDEYEEFDEPEEFTPPQQQAPRQPMAAYWTPNDELEYSRVANGLSQVESDLTNGELDPVYGKPLLDQLHQRREQFEGRKQQAALQKTGQERLRVSDELAFQQSVQQRNMEGQAGAFMGTTAVFKDPEGKSPTQYFYQKRPGEFEPIAPGTPEADEMVDVPTEMEAFVEDRDGPAPMPEPTPAPAPQTDPFGSFRQTITNGATETQVIRDPQGRVIGLEGSPMGLRGVIGSAGRNGENLDENVATEAWRRAEAAIPGERSPERFQRVQQEFAKQLPRVEQQHEAVQIGNQFGLSPQQVQFARQQANSALAGLPPRQAQRQFQGVFNKILGTMGVSQRQHTAQKIKEQREAQKKEQQEVGQRKEKLFETEYSKLQKDIEHEQQKKAKAEAEGDTMYKTPDHLMIRDEEELAAMAQERAKRKFATIYGRDWETGQPIEKKAAEAPKVEAPKASESRPAPQQPVALPPGLEDKSLAELLRLKAEREKKKNAPPAQYRDPDRVPRSRF